MSLYVIGIGGTGSKTLEAIMQMASVGVFTEEPIKVLFVDADETNGNLERARISLSVYQRCQQRVRETEKDGKVCNWMQTEIKTYLPDVWSPFGQTSLNKNLGAFFGYNNLSQNHEALGHLFDVLYTREEREANLDVGFRGRPAIGSAIMSRLDLNDLSTDPWASLIKDIKADAGSGRFPKVFLCGSIFGGTGASGLPTLGRLLHNQLENENIRGSVKIACLFVLPYFRFSSPTGEEAKNGEVYANADQFLLNTEAALRYYRDQHSYFDTIYLLGNQNLPEYKFSIGKNTQKNEPHFIELYGALAARHFLTKTPKNPGTVVLNSRQDKKQLIWTDFPEMAEVKQELVNGVRFAYIWLSNILPELKTAQKSGLPAFIKGAPWFVDFFEHKGGVFSGFSRQSKELPDFNDAQEQEAIDIISNWCKDFLRWIVELHKSGGDEVQLFRYRDLANLDGRLTADVLSNLIINDGRDQKRRDQDTIQAIKESLNPDSLRSPNQTQTFALKPPNTGVAGLARSLYILSRL